MIPFLIKLLNKLTAFLENIEKADNFTSDNIWKTVGATSKPKKFFDIKNIFLLLAPTGIFIFWIAVVTVAIIRHTWEDYYFLFALLFSQLIQIINYIGVIKKIKSDNSSMLRYFYFIYLPLLIATYSSFACFESVIIHNNFKDVFFVILKTILPSLLIWIYPILFIISQFFPNIKSKIFNWLKKSFLLYNLWFFLVLTIYIALISIWFNIDFRPWSLILNEIMRVGNHSFDFIEGIFYIIFSFLVLTYGIFTLNIYFGEVQKSRKKLHIWILFVIAAYIFIFVINVIPSFIEGYYRDQIKKASIILTKEWENYKWFTDSKVFFLENAFINGIKNGRLEDAILFQKLYDSTPEEYFGEKISDYTNSRRSFATNLSKIGEKAEVLLSLTEIQNKINTGSVFPVLETIYTFSFTNVSEKNENQEVIINFQAPTKDSVVSSLRLWLNLELTWQIAPRWAARQVYENSLKKNIDPALIEKIWLNTYNLRVFPVPRKNDSATNWKQKVEIKILTPLLNPKNEIVYSPKFSFINLKFNSESALISKVYNLSKLIKEDIVNKWTIEEFLSKDHLIEMDGANIQSNSKYCIDEKLILDNKLRQIVTNIINSTWSANFTKTNIYFDNSSSVERNWAQKYYKDIYEKIKKFWNTLNDVDLYSYNYQVDKISAIDDVKFYWYSDMDKVVSHITKSNIQNERIILITDDSSFDYGTEENKEIDYSLISSNQISIIKIGKNVKSYKNEINNILSATNGNIYEINSASDIDSAITKILNIQKDDKLELCQTGVVNDENNLKIQGWFVSRMLISSIKNSQERIQVWEEQTKIATMLNIVNEFNSLIALQMYSQQEELDNYSNQKDKYETEYKNYEWWRDDMSVGISENSVINSNITNTAIPSASIDIQDSPSLDNVRLEGSTTNSINFWTNKINSSVLNGSSIKWTSSLMEFEWRINLNFLWLLMFLVYTIEFVSIIHFIINYTKGNKNKDEANN